MSRPQKTENEWGENTSDHRQWHERERGPTIKRIMLPHEIEFFKQVLINSYECRSDDITWTFEKFKHVNAEDDDQTINNDDFLILTYRLKCVVHNVPQNRVVFKCKVPIPENVKRDYSQVRNQNQQRMLTAQ